MKHKDSSKCESLIQEAHHYHQQGEIEKAEAVCRKVQRIQPLNFNALQILGAIALKRHNYQQAIKFLAAAYDIHRDIPGLNVNLGIAYKHDHQFEQAKICFERAVSLDKNFGSAYYYLAIMQIDEKSLLSGYALLRESERCQPGHVPTLELLARILQQLGRFDEAVNYYLRILKSGVRSAELYFALGLAYQSNKSYQDAVNAYSMAIDLNPERIDIQAKLADVLESVNRVEEARAHAESILAIEPTQPIANLVISRIERHAGNLSVARDQLQLLPLHTPPTDSDAAILTELGMIRDRLGEYESAYDAFTQANNIMASLPEAQIGDPMQALRLVASCRNWLDSYSDIQPLITDNLPSPVFLVGFPRSGTTLTEQILAAHVNVATSDELPALHNMAITLGEKLGGMQEYPACLDSLTTEDIHQLRELYWTQVIAVHGESIIEKLFIDKNPLNIIHLGFISRIFPESKVIVVLRDPRDVCLSCFMQLFHLNESMMQFLSMKKTVDYYAATMNLWLAYREKLSLPWMELRYEDIVVDSAEATRTLKDFLGLVESGTQEAFYKQAAQRPISTPSYHDVSTPVYSRAKGRWRHYADQMEPVLSTLAPYVEIFGYDK